MDCASCGARTKHALPLSERTYTCTACGISSPRDKNSARVMLVRAGLNPAGADRVRAGGPRVPGQREPEIPALLQGGEDVKQAPYAPERRDGGFRPVRHTTVRFEGPAVRSAG
ncbi:zinc ribbon domain-containing protein, partial [Streptomyces sp. NPDC019224]|uniref:zinc ribbon domain-containing protein n=1 Tax=Streptomyces sp. NPDC019224 TaxID=3154484 RepID=UPI0033D1A7A6